MKELTAAVYCSAREIEDLKEVGYKVGTVLGHLGYNIVYGGGYQGVMGAVARGGEAVGTKVSGISTYHLMGTEAEDFNQDTTVFLESMGERKAMMRAMSDVTVILGGGFGTLDELFEVLTLNQIGLSNQPIIIYDETEEMIEAIKRLVDIMCNKGTISKEDPGMITYISSYYDLLCHLSNLKEEEYDITLGNTLCSD